MLITLQSRYRLPEVVRLSPHAPFSAERPYFHSEMRRLLNGAEVKCCSCDPHWCGLVTEDTLADTQTPGWFTVSWWFSWLQGFAEAENEWSPAPVSVIRAAMKRFLQCVWQPACDLQSKEFFPVGNLFQRRLWPHVTSAIQSISRLTTSGPPVWLWVV